MSVPEFWFRHAALSIEGVTLKITQLFVHTNPQVCQDRLHHALYMPAALCEWAALLGVLVDFTEHCDVVLPRRFMNDTTCAQELADHGVPSTLRPKRLHALWEQRLWAPIVVADCTLSCTFPNEVACLVRNPNAVGVKEPSIVLKHQLIGAVKAASARSALPFFVEALSPVLQQHRMVWNEHPFLTTKESLHLDICVPQQRSSTVQVNYTTSVQFGRQLRIERAHVQHGVLPTCGGQAADEVGEDARARVSQHPQHCPIVRKNRATSFECVSPFQASRLRLCQPSFLNGCKLATPSRKPLLTAQ
mmetsp:Transcript_78373/g.253497  ORF Transcript_78373/g.253497 Transcript_78373/m.253497 type:complete len:304 (-) Transcript_78373:2740-3651(-)